MLLLEQLLLQYTTMILIMSQMYYVLFLHQNLN